MTQPPVVDQEARDLAADPTLNVALEASAGTGKTSVLVERYVQLVAQGASPRHVLAITFTRKAAGEMRSRIVAELRSRSELWRRLRTRLLEIHITTIDAFCLGLLREFPLEAGLDPDVGLLDEVDTARLLEDAMEGALREERRRGRIDMSFLVARFGEAALRRGMRDFLGSRLLKEGLLSRYVERVVPTGVHPTRSLRRLSETLRSAFRGEEGVERLLETTPENLRGLRFALRRAIDAERVVAADVEALAAHFLTRTGQPRKRVPPSCRRAEFETPEAYQTHRDRFLAAAPFVARAYRVFRREKDYYAIRELVALYRSAAERFAALKSARAGLDFTDVLVRAVALLERRGEFSQSRFRLESRYHHLLIDEFQDTNDVQWRLIRALIDSWGEGQGLVQDAIQAEQAAGTGSGRLTEPSLFLVGDRKQSIYGWRDARVEVLESASRYLLGIRPGGRRLTLRTSFRASGALLSFLNDVFDDVTKVSGELDWSFQYREGDHFPVAERDDAARPIAVAVDRDLRRVAARVADEVVRVLEEEGRRPKDIAILFRSRASYRVYEDALVERGVPAYVYRGLGFFDSPEVRDVSALVRFLAEPGSDLRSAELARSRLVGLSDPALVRIASKRQRLAALFAASRVEETSIPEADRAVLERARRRVGEWLPRVDRVPPADLIQSILDEVDYAACFVGDEQSWENLKKILEMARRAQNRGYLTMSRLADYLESASTDEESPAVLDAIDAVNLMTVHAAKGLEFDTVFLVNLQKRTRADRSLPRVRELPDGSLEVHAVAPSEVEESLPNRVEEEEKRLLYVGLTRARRNLVLSTVLSRRAQSDDSFYRLLPEGLRSLMEEAVSSERDELSWKSHAVRVLGVHERSYGQARTESVHVLAIGRLGVGATAALAVEEGSDAAPRRLAETLRRDELRPLLAEGTPHLRVPYVSKVEGGVERGTIDALIVTAERVYVVGLPGRTAEELARHVAIATGLYPDATIEALPLG